MKKNSFQIGRTFEEQIKDLIVKNGFTESTSDNSDQLQNKEFFVKATVKGKFCKWKPDFLLRNDDKTIVILEAKNPDPKDPVNVGISFRELVTMFYDITSGSTQYQLAAVTGDSVDAEKAHRGFTKLLREGLGTTLFTVSEFNTVVSNSFRTNESKRENA